MPIILPDGLPSAAMLRREGIEVLDHPPRSGADLRIGLLSLTPDAARTEVCLARLLGATRRLVELVPGLPASCPASTGAEIYARGGEAAPPPLDGLIVTCAPPERAGLRDVPCWGDLVHICARAHESVAGTLYIGWPAFAALHVFHAVRLRRLPHGIAGIFGQQVMDPAEPLTARLGRTFPCPVSRQIKVEIHDVPWRRGLLCLAQSPASGLCLVADPGRRAHYLFDHVERDAETPGEDNGARPPPVWRPTAERLFANWLALLAARRPSPAQLGQDACREAFAGPGG